MGNGKKEILLLQMDACHNVENWFAPLNIAIEGLSEEDASRCDSADTNSIYEIVNHLLFYNERYLNRFRGISVNEVQIDNDATFQTRNMDWQSAAKKLDCVLAEWKNALLECDEEKLEDTLPGREDTWSSVISDIIIHNAYHIGQIVQIRKQQGTWKPRNW